MSCSRTLLLLCLALLLPACGGGSTSPIVDPGPPELEPPPEAPVNHAPRAVQRLGLNARAGESVTGAYSRFPFEDADGDPLTLEATSPDGSPLPNWIAFDTGTLELTAKPTEEHIGVTTVCLTATDPEGARAQLLMAVRVSGGTLPSFTTLVSRTASEQGNGLSIRPSISGGGHRVGFRTYATNLHPDTLNDRTDVLVRHMPTGDMLLVNADENGEGNWADAAKLSYDGLRVAYLDSTQRLPSDTNLYYELFVKDFRDGSLTQINVTPTGESGAGAEYPAMSADGSTVSWSTPDDSLVSDDTNNGRDVFVAPATGGPVERVSVDADGKQTSPDNIGIETSISADGRIVAFETRRIELTGTQFRWHIVVKNRDTGAVILASTTEDGTPATSNAQSPSLSADGRYVAFHTSANLDGDSTPGTVNVFVKDLWTGKVERASEDEEGSEKDGTYSYGASISADGRYVAFTTNADLDADDENGQQDVYVKELDGGHVHWVSRGTTQDGPSGDSRWPSLSANAMYVAFESAAEDVVGGDANGEIDVFWAKTQMPRRGTHRDDDLSGIGSSNGRDHLRGLAGNDILRGGPDQDVLEGGPGFDEMWGGPSSDTFVWFDVSEGLDQILDFQTGPIADELDLSAALDRTAGGTAGDYVRFVEDGTHTTVEVDPDGPGSAAAFTPLVVLVDTLGLSVDELIERGILILE